MDIGEGLENKYFVPDLKLFYNFWNQPYVPNFFNVYFLTYQFIYLFGLNILKHNLGPHLPQKTEEWETHSVIQFIYLFKNKILA